MLDGLKKWATSAFERAAKANLEDFLLIDSADPSGRVLVARDGSLATLVRVDGMRRMMGDEEMEAVTRAGTAALHPFMVGPGHAMQVWFMRDPDLSASMVARMVRAKRAVADAMRLELDDLFSERERYLPRYMVHESFYIALWTRLTIFSRQELERIGRDMKPPPGWPRSTDMADIFRAGTQIRTRHSSFVSAFLSEMGQAGLRLNDVGVHEAAQAMREGVFPELAEARWSPWLPGDVSTHPGGRERVPPARIGPYPHRRNDVGPLLWPRMREHVFPLSAEVVSPTLVRMGGNLVSCVDVTVGPQQVQPFQRFLNAVIHNGEFPWRVSFLVEADGLGRMHFKSLLAALSSLGNPNSALIRDSIRALQARKVEGEAIVRMRASFATWAPSDNRRLAEERAVRLLKLVETWGLQTATQSVGDPLEGVLSSALCLGVSSTAPAGAEPLRDVVARLPWMRDASPYSTGSVLFRTFDGRMWPYQPGSTEHQDTSIDFVYAPPGKGKSVLLNTTNLGFCLNAQSAAGTGGAQLPRVSIIDVGMSSAGVISLLQSALPPELRHQVLYRRLRWSKEDSINPFDTQLGYRKPLPTEFDFLVNFLSLLGTEPGRDAPPDGLTDMCRMVIEEVYEQFSDESKTGNPKRYVADEDPEVDAALARAGVEPPEDASWWWVTDRLFEAFPGEEGVRVASLAQRHAVPLLEELSKIAGGERVHEIFGDTQVPGSGERLIKMFIRLVASVMSAYPILVEPTRLSLGGARVISLDLNDVAPGAGTPNSNKQTAIVYMLARFVLARDFYIYPEHLKGAPALYKDHHERRITRLRETPKRLVFDEFHRTKAARSVREQVIVDMREGRKHGVQIALASQMLQDFDPEMLALGSGFWIMGNSNEREKEETARTFGLSATAQSCLNDLTGARRDGGGAPFLVVLNMRDGTHEHLLLNTLGPVELWAFTTKPDDANLRNRLYDSLGPVEARRRLAARFPSGSAESEIKERKERMEREVGRVTPDGEKGVLAALAEELAVRASP